MTANQLQLARNLELERANRAREEHMAKELKEQRRQFNWSLPLKAVSTVTGGFSDIGRGAAGFANANRYR